MLCVVWEEHEVVMTPLLFVGLLRMVISEEMSVSPGQTVGDHPNLSALDSISRLRSRSVYSSRQGSLLSSTVSTAGSQRTRLTTSAPPASSRAPGSVQ